MNDIYKLVEKDLRFAISMYKKYDLPLSTWYWRSLNESVYQWIDNKAIQALDKKYYKSVLRVNNMSISYDIDLATNHVKIIKQDNETYVSYDELYEYLENIVRKINMNSHAYH